MEMAEQADRVVDLPGVPGKSGDEARGGAVGAQNRGPVGGRHHAMADEVGELPVVGLFQGPPAQRGVGRAS
ncbi:hypothetical protein [Streptomyces mirabilis]|uniref:hypothetical protein n=1 Tax=Streptomyces mirabilis TaxID=68239 RepID=UPI00331FA8D8